MLLGGQILLFCLSVIGDVYISEFMSLMTLKNLHAIDLKDDLANFLKHF